MLDKKEGPDLEQYSGRRRALAVTGRIIGTAALVCFLGALVFFCIFALYIYNFILPQAELNTEGFSLDQTSVVYYLDEGGEPVELQRLYGSENRIWARYEEIPSDLIFACVAIEDKRFFDHKGVDWLRTTRACANMFLGDRSSFGGSTITQQLIKNLTEQDEVTVRRKLIEIFRALKFEQNYDKRDILEWYLNTIYLGEQCYGVKSAAYAYFGKDVSQLSTAECAALIGITNNPSIYDPYINPEKCIERQKDILWAMHQQGYLEDDEYEAAKNQELVFQWSRAENEENQSYVYSYFIDQVLRDVASDLADATGYSYDIASQMVLSGGYSIYATIDPDVQNALEAVYENELNIPATTGTWQTLQSAMVVVDNETGDIAGLVGGLGEKTGSLTLSRATQSYLSPGSAIKPVAVYALALEDGLITPQSVYDDTPFSTYNGNPWPRNQNRVYRGLISVETAMAESTNTVAVKILDQLGLRRSFVFATETMGLRGLVDEVTINGKPYTDLSYGALALGGLTRGVTVKSMTEAYAAFANAGVYRSARTYTQVLDSAGNVVLSNPQNEHTAVSEKTAWYLTDMMEATVERGTGSDARLENMAVAGKTGTTSNDQDKWFAGYTPYYTAVTWTGYDEPEEIVLTDSTANPAAELWRKVMTKLHQNLPSRSFEKPSTVVTCQICADSGMLAGEWCQRDLRGSRVFQAELALEDMPTAVCTRHVPVDFCSVSGKAANEYCGNYEGVTLTQHGMLDLVRNMIVDGVVVEDQQYTVPGRDDEIPAGYFRAETGVEHPANEQCTEHEKPEEPERPEDNPDSAEHGAGQDGPGRRSAGSSGSGGNGSSLRFWDWLGRLFGNAA